MPDIRISQLEAIPFSDVDVSGPYRFGKATGQLAQTAQPQPESIFGKERFVPGLGTCAIDGFDSAKCSWTIEPSVEAGGYDTQTWSEINNVTGPAFDEHRRAVEQSTDETAFLENADTMRKILNKATLLMTYGGEAGDMTKELFEKRIAAFIWTTELEQPGMHPVNQLFKNEAAALLTGKLRGVFLDCMDLYDPSDEDQQFELAIGA